MSEDAVNLIKFDLGLSQVSLIGHSMGGRTAMWTALNNPELIDKLVVVDISPCNTQFDVSTNTVLPSHNMQAAKLCFPSLP